MWRGYGMHGNGAALVFDTSKVTLITGSPFTLATVSYAPTSRRISELEKLLDDWAKLTNSLNLTDDKLYLASFMALQLIKTYALVTKHSGFSEEREWRIVYQAENDRDGLLKSNLSYHIGAHGVEPKLKWKISPIPNVSGEGLTLDNIVHRIILGPSVSHPLARKSIERMLEKIGKPQLKDRLIASTISTTPNVLIATVRPSAGQADSGCAARSVFR